MTFLSPWAFWWLMSIPLLVLLYLVRERRKEVVVPSLLLWRRALKPFDARRPARRLERTLLLLVQILAVCAAALALARPQLPGLFGGDLVLVVDVSLSMQARDVLPNRFEAARHAAMELVQRTALGRSVAVIAAARTPRLIQPLSSPAAAREALRRLEPTDGEADLEAAITLARALRRPGRPLEVHLFSDQAFPGVTNHLFGRTADNVAISDLLAVPEEDHGVRVVLRVRNDATRALRVPLAVRVDGSEVVRTALSVPARGERVLTLRVPEGELVEAALLSQDVLPADDRRYALARPRLPSVLLVGPPTYLLEALRAMGITADRWDRVDPHLWSRYDVVVVNRPIGELPPGNALLIRTLPANLPVAANRVVRASRVLRWHRTHPLLRFVDLQDLRVADALALEPKAGEVLAEGEHPLIWAYASETHRVVLLAFDPAQSDFPLRPSFPVFVYNAVHWLTGGLHQAREAQDRLVLPAGAQEAWLEGPLGRLRAQAGVFQSPPLDRAGVYRLRAASGSDRLVVVQPASTDPPLPPPPLPPTPQAPLVRASGSRELWRAFLGVLLLLLVAEAWLYRRQQGLSWRPLWARRSLLRTAQVILVAVALLDPRIPLSEAPLHVVFVLDRSDSVLPDQAAWAERFVEEASRYRRPQDRVGLVTFGGSAVVEQLPREQPLPPPTLRPLPMDTDIGGAIDRALEILPESGPRRVVLLSDGADLQGRALQAAQRARAAGVEVSVVPLLRPPDEEEAWIEEVVAPAEVREGERFRAEVLVRSTREQRVRVELRSGQQGSVQEVRVRIGTTAVPFSVRGEQGWMRLVARIHPERDRIPENNVVQTFVRVFGPPSILYVGSGDLPLYLEAQGLRVFRALPEQLSGNAASLAVYDAVVLEDVPAHRLSRAQMEALRTYVASLGGGLVAIGGPHAYGPGGYAGTPLEETLPVFADVRHPLRLPLVAVVLVLDTSASMTGLGTEPAKVELAKETARSLLDTLRDGDLIGVIAFDQEYRWLVPLIPARERGRIGELIARLRTGGGTNLWPALRAAAEALEGVRARVKHVVVLSDGQTDPGDFQSLALRMRKQGITVTAVSVGQDADVAFMQRLSAWGGGRHYHARDPYTIPQLLAAEAALTVRAYLVEERFAPQRVGSTLLSGLSSPPPLSGYVATSPKPAAQVHLLSSHRDPLLATWQYGLGRAVAFTSDTGSRWAGAWRRWPDFAAFWSRLVRWSLRTPGGPLEVHMTLRGARLEAAVDARDPQGNPIDGLVVQGMLVGQGSRSVRFRQTAAGWYEGHALLPSPGTYAFFVTAYREGKPVATKTVPLSLPYSPELRPPEGGVSVLERVAEITGGRVLKSPKEAFARTSQARADQVIWGPLASVALGLFLAEVALRRLGAVREAVEGFARCFGRAPGGDRAYEEASRWRMEEEPLPESTEALVRTYIARLRQTKNGG